MRHPLKPGRQCDFVRGDTRCRAVTMCGRAQCYAHIPERVAYAEERRAERAKDDDARGIRRCEALTLSTGARCFNLAMPQHSTCAQHDPDAIRARAASTAAYLKARSRELALAVEQRRLELEAGIDRLQRRYDALVRDDITLRRDVRDRRAELAELKRELEGEAEHKRKARGA